MDPQSYAARTRYRRPSEWYLRLDGIGVALTSLGLAPRGAVTLAVRGRTSGKVRRLPILTIPFDGADHLVALAGESQWVRNVRAADGRATLRRRRRRSVVLHELPLEERAPVLQAYLRTAEERGGRDSAEQQARFYFGVDAGAAIEELAAIAEHYPVFRVAEA